VAQAAQPGTGKLPEQRLFKWIEDERQRWQCDSSVCIVLVVDHTAVHFHEGTGLSGKQRLRFHTAGCLSPCERNALGAGDLALRQGNYTTAALLLERVLPATRDSSTHRVWRRLC